MSRELLRLLRQLRWLVPLLLAVCLPAMTAFPAVSAAEGRSNIVVVLADDQTWSDSGVYGNRDVPTPNIDRLAAAGMRFRQAFTSTAMCAPTRQQLYTGLYPVHSGAYPNHSIVAPGTRSIVHAFRDLGYRVGLTGKTHFGPVESFPFETVGTKRDGFLALVDLEAAEAFIARDGGQPFLLVVASNSPHEPWTEGDAAAFDPASLAVPPYLADTPATRAALVRYYAEISHFDGQLGAILDILERRDLATRTLVLYTSEQGASLPFGKWTLYDAGIRTALVVRWPGRVAPGSVSDAMVAYVDVLPTLVEAAGGTPPEVDGRSFLGVLTGERKEHRRVVFGVHTNRGIIGGKDYPIRSVRTARYKLISNLLPEAEYANILTTPQGGALLASWRAAATAGDERAQQRLDAYLRRPRWELYDLQQDPLELRNLADDPRSIEVRDDLARQLAAWMAEQGDGGLDTERQALEHMNPEILRLLDSRFGPAWRRSFAEDPP